MQPEEHETVQRVLQRAAARDQEAERRDARAREVAASLDEDPTALTAVEVARLAEVDRAAAASDRDAAAEDLDTLARLILGRPPCEVPLRPREVEVLRCIARGRTTAEIAEELYIGANTVKTHTHAIYKKLGVRSRTEAAVWAKDSGLC